MAKLTISQDRADEWLRELGEDIYLPMIEKLAPIVAESTVPEGLPDKIRSKLIKEAIDKNEWSMSLTSNSRQGVVSISGPTFTMRRVISLKKKTIAHAYFEVGQKLQGKGLSSIVLETTDKVSQRVGISKVVLDANLDVGGYAWLRKGFFPESVEKLLDVAVDTKGGNLILEFESIISKMSDADVREYVLTEDFKRFKDLFLGSSWEGSADLSNPVTRKAFTGSANAAASMIKRQIGPPSTANEKVLNDLVKHQTYLMRYSGSLRNAGVASLTNTEKELRALIMRYTEDFEGLAATSKEAKKLYKEMAEEISKVRAKAWDEIKEDIPEEYLSFATLEQLATIRIIEGAFPVVLGLQPLSVEHIKRIVKAQPFEGRTLKEWLAYNQEIDAERITRIAKNAMIAGQTPTEVARAAMGTKRLDYRDGQARKAFRDLESVYLTVTNGIANEIKADLYKENDDIIDKVMFVATLDIHTTVECAGHDGHTFKLGSEPKPPLHFRCRSLLVPYISPENLRNRGFDANTEKMLVSDFAEENGLGKITNVNSLPRGYKTAYTKWARTRKRELIGQVPATQNFDTWLRNQSPEFQNEYLGPGRAAIFRQGKLTLDKFVTRDGYELTIADLTKLSEAA